LQLHGRNIEIKRSLKKGFVPADTTNFTSSTKFTGIFPSTSSAPSNPPQVIGAIVSTKNVNTSSKTSK
jgi:hypothetical protein